MSETKETAADLKVNQIQEHTLNLDPNNIKIFSGNANPATRARCGGTYSASRWAK